FRRPPTPGVLSLSPPPSVPRRQIPLPWPSLQGVVSTSPGVRRDRRPAHWGAVVGGDVANPFPQGRWRLCLAAGKSRGGGQAGAERSDRPGGRGLRRWSAGARSSSPAPHALTAPAAAPRARPRGRHGEWDEQDPAWPVYWQLQRTRHFKESIKFIHECRLQGEGCLVHCLAGVSRSVTLVVAYIMTVTDFGWEDALHTVRAGRSCANPNLGFQRQLQEFEELQVHQFRQWLREEYGESPLRDAEEARSILAAPGILKLWPFLRRP
uniref:Tyrosine specific protein phosphatases domain-containing protein n=1 Tax=Bos mutus grunniens TaxID=30521 RepID=A0A8B9XC02_BOSMU